MILTPFGDKSVALLAKAGDLSIYSWHKLKPKIDYWENSVLIQLIPIRVYSVKFPMLIAFWNINVINEYRISFSMIKMTKAYKTLIPQ